MITQEYVKNQKKQKEAERKKREKKERKKASVCRQQESNGVAGQSSLKFL